MQGQRTYERSNFRWISYIALLLAGVLLFLALRGMNWGEFWQIIQNVRLEFITLAVLLASANSLVRALRWRVLLSAERWLGVLDVFWAMMVGYLGNAYLPARAGEVLRSVALGSRAQISTGFVLATALTERILDAVVLVLIGSAALSMLPETPPALLNAGRGMALFSAAGLVGVLTFPLFERPIKWMLVQTPLPPTWKTRLSNLLEQFLLGMRSLRNMRRALGFFALTIVIWLGDAFVAILVATSLGLNFSIPLALLLNVALGLSSAIPSTPGYIGVYQFVAVTVLNPYGFSRSQALAFIMVFQVLGYVLITCWGLLGLWRLKLFGNHVDMAP